MVNFYEVLSFREPLRPENPLQFHPSLIFLWLFIGWEGKRSAARMLQLVRKLSGPEHLNGPFYIANLLLVLQVPCSRWTNYSSPTQSPSLGMSGWAPDCSLSLWVCQGGHLTTRCILFCGHVRVGTWLLVVFVSMSGWAPDYSLNFLLWWLEACRHWAPSCFSSFTFWFSTFLFSIISLIVLRTFSIEWIQKE